MLLLLLYVVKTPEAQAVTKKQIDTDNYLDFIKASSREVEEYWED
jgi:hypothetical protein